MLHRPDQVAAGRGCMVLGVVGDDLIEATGQKAGVHQSVCGVDAGADGEQRRVAGFAVAEGFLGGGLQFFGLA